MSEPAKNKSGSQAFFPGLPLQEAFQVLFEGAGINS